MNKAFARVLVTTVALGSISVAAPAWAQEADASEEAADSGEIVVTAQRRSEALEKTPVAVAVVSADSLARQAITSERDLQFATPGLTVRASQNDNQLNYSLRGQTVDAYTSSLPSVLPYVNEVQVGGAGATAFFDLQSVQVLKGPQGTLFGRNSTGGAVLFTTAKPSRELSGFASARYGRFNDIQVEGAVGGPIAGDSVLVRVAGSYRNRDGYQLNLFNGEKLGKVDRLGLRFSLSINPDGPVGNEFVADYYRANGTSISPVVSYVVPVANNATLNPAVPFNAILDATNFAPGLVAFGAAQNARGPYVVDVDSVSKHRTRKWIVSNVTSFELNDDTKIKNVFGYVRSNYFDAGDIDGTRYGIDGRGNAATGPFGGDGQIRQLSEELQLQGKAMDGGLEYVLGGYYSNNKEHLHNTSFIANALGAPPQINSGTTRSKALAGYAQATLDTGLAGFKLTAGLRYTSEKVSFVRDADDQWVQPAYDAFFADGRFTRTQKDTFKKLSWTFGLQNQVTPDLLLYANTRRSFRSGGFNFHAPPTPGFANTSGGEFRPEVATDVELGAKYRGDAGGTPVRMNLALYNMWVENLQRANYVAIFGALAAVTSNVPKAKITGFELDGNIKPAEWLTLGGSLNYTNARFTDPRVAVLAPDGSGTTITLFNTYPDTPKWSGALYADVTVPVSQGWDMTLHGDVYRQTSNWYSSTGRTLNPNTQIPGYTLANFRIGVEQSSGQGWSFAALVKNAFKETYYNGGIGFASLFTLNIVVPGEPRTYMLEARYRF
jgi:iron complex outermembrane receptor protein